VGIALDLAHQRLLVADAIGAIHSVGLADGISERIATGVGLTIGSSAIAYDSATNSVLALDVDTARLRTIDLDTGVRSVVGGHGPALLWPRSVTVDAERQVAFVIDDAYDAVLAVDLRTGNRQLIAK
jgi:hypothetical protein